MTMSFVIHVRTRCTIPYISGMDLSSQMEALWNFTPRATSKKCEAVLKTKNYKKTNNYSSLVIPQVKPRLLSVDEYRGNLEL